MEKWYITAYLMNILKNGIKYPISSRICKGKGMYILIKVHLLGIQRHRRHGVEKIGDTRKEMKLW